jgi:hypothetical protein
MVAKNIFVAGAVLLFSACGASPDSELSDAQGITSDNRDIVLYRDGNSTYASICPAGEVEPSRLTCPKSIGYIYSSAYLEGAYTAGAVSTSDYTLINNELTVNKKMQDSIRAQLPSLTGSDLDLYSLRLEQLEKSMKGLTLKKTNMDYVKSQINIAHEKMLTQDEVYIFNGDNLENSVSKGLVGPFRAQIKAALGR